MLFANSEARNSNRLPDSASGCRQLCASVTGLVDNSTNWTPWNRLKLREVSSHTIWKSQQGSLNKTLWDLLWTRVILFDLVWLSRTCLSDNLANVVFGPSSHYGINLKAIKGFGSKRLRMIFVYYRSRELVLNLQCKSYTVIGTCSAII